MSLAELQLTDLRCIRQARIEPHPRLTLIWGPNGSGKTSLLEAIYLLGRGRSFRTRQTEQLVRRGEAALTVFGRLHPGPSGLEHTLGLRFSHEEGTLAQVDGRAADSLAELSATFPVQVIDPGIHRLIEEGPLPRRRWLDWAVFHVEPSFIPQWQQYTRALRQRNAALKGGADPTVWDGELVRLGERITASREQLLKALQPHWEQTLSALDAVPATLGFAPGWSREASLAEALASHLPRDRERGHTSAGPHRFDVVLRLEGAPLRDIVSRGQQKLLGAAMAVSMARLVAASAGEAPTLLLDDPAAELDAPHREALLGAVAALGGQQILTALTAAEHLLGRPDRVFHVEQGGVKSV